MKYPHIVVKNGVWYPAGAEVPEDILREVESADDMPEGAQESGHTKRGRKPKEA